MKPEYVGTDEISEMLGLKLTRQRVQQIVSKKTFPEPVAVLSQGRVWRRMDVHQWIQLNRYTDKAITEIERFHGQGNYLIDVPEEEEEEL